MRWRRRLLRRQRKALKKRACKALNLIRMGRLTCAIIDWRDIESEGAENIAKAWALPIHYGAPATGPTVASVDSSAPAIRRIEITSRRIGRASLEQRIGRTVRK